MNQELYRHGIELFNRGRFYDAHEVLEDVWRETAPPQKLFLQGLIQVAVGLHHHSTGNRAGCLSLLARAGRNLAHYPGSYCDIDLERFRDEVREWRAAVSSHQNPLPAAPRIRLQAAK